MCSCDLIYPDLSPFTDQLQIHYIFINLLNFVKQSIRYTQHYVSNNIQ